MRKSLVSAAPAIAFAACTASAQAYVYYPDAITSLVTNASDAAIATIEIADSTGASMSMAVEIAPGRAPRSFG
jgi:hypothetical protein